MPKVRVNKDGRQTESLTGIGLTENWRRNGIPTKGVANMKRGINYEKAKVNPGFGRICSGWAENRILWLTLQNP